MKSNNSKQSKSSPLLKRYYIISEILEVQSFQLEAHKINNKYMYSDTAANKDNSFWNHIRWPKSSLAET
jgi:hypothetical protein